MAYLLIVGLVAAVMVIINFPTMTDNNLAFPHGKVFLPFGELASPDQGLILLAMLAGITGSFLHASQSLITYVGNASFKASWTAWYFLRPWIGGILGFAIYFAFRAGLVAGANAVNPYGVIALSLLGGWFSKTTTDKLQEVFETMFKTDEDSNRKDKLRDFERPCVLEIKPSPVSVNTNEIMILGCNFIKGAVAFIDGQKLETEFKTETELIVSIIRRPAPGKQVLIQIKNPTGQEPLSKEFKIRFD